MAYFRDYQYVDARFDHASGKSKSWMRILRAEIDRKVKGPSGNLNCFTTVQNFADAISNRDTEGKTDQVHYCPPYFDFDARAEDYDNDMKLALAASKNDASKLVTWFLQLGIDPPQIRVYFSGSKGFHVTVHPDVFAVRPHRYLTYVIKCMAMYLKELLHLRTMDSSVYTIPRMWRLRDSAHQKTGLYKIELLSNKFGEMPVDKIIEEAKTPRMQLLWGKEENENVQPVDDAVSWFGNFITTWAAENDLRLLRPKLPVIKTEEWPVCVKDIIENGLKRPGTRNQATLSLVTYFRDTGVSEKDCAKIIGDWNHKHFSADGDHKLIDRNANARSVVRSVYDPRAKYRFACQFMLALKGITPDRRVACVGVPNCPTVNGKSAQEKEENQRPSSIPSVSLNQVGSASFNGQPVRFAFHVSGKTREGYIVPRSLTSTCVPQPQTELCKKCPSCSNNFTDGEMDDKNSAGLTSKRTQMLDHTNRLMLALIDVPDEQKRSKMRAAMKIPARCMAHHIEEESKGNLEKLRLIPLVDDGGAYVPHEDADDATSGSEGSLGDEHVVMQAFHLVDLGTKKIRANQKYIAEGVPYESPRDQSATVLIYKHQPAQDDIASFKVTPELHEELMVFQPEAQQTVSEKMHDIHDDLEINVHHINGRSDVAIAMDMSYHSVLSFWFQEQRVQKGWVELLVIGDTGQGKTEMVKSLIRHYRLGEMTGAEGAKRTGLVWAMVQLGGTMELEWGKIPQNDQRLLVIDEFSGMSKEDIGMMTRLRSEGIAESQGMNQQQTYARTRLVMLTNPRDGHPMNYYDHGALAVRGLCDSVADIRRIDLAVALASNDLDVDVANQLHGSRVKEHRYTQDLCRNLILFAWSRREKDIVFDKGTTEMILDAAKTMGPKYECSVGLVSTSDQRLKIARLAVSCACRLYSVDPVNPRKVLVKKEHVQFVVDLLNRCYRAKNMQLDRVADKERKKSNINPTEDKRIRTELRDHPHWQEIVSILLDTGYWRKDSFSEQSGLTRDETNEFIRWASRNRMIQSTTGGYRKNPVFTDILKRVNVNDPSPDGDDIGKDPDF
jgi:MCM P-loop domain